MAWNSQISHPLNFNNHNSLEKKLKPFFYFLTWNGNSNDGDMDGGSINFMK